MDYDVVSQPRFTPPRIGRMCAVCGLGGQNLDLRAGGQGEEEWNGKGSLGSNREPPKTRRMVLGFGICTLSPSGSVSRI